MDDVIRELRKISGFGAYVILNNDGRFSIVLISEYVCFINAFLMQEL